MNQSLSSSASSSLTGRSSAGLAGMAGMAGMAGSTITQPLLSSSNSDTQRTLAMIMQDQSLPLCVKYSKLRSTGFLIVVWQIDFEIALLLVIGRHV
jgi:hypothetical protein